jgi:hypothetical protein
MKNKYMGWQCPNCLVVYSPSVQNCVCSSIPKEPSVSLSGGAITVNNGFCVGNSGLGTGTTTSTAWICLGFRSDNPDGLCTKCSQPQWKHAIISHT